MDSLSQKKHTKSEAIKSNVFSDDSEVECIFLEQKTFRMYKNHNDPFSYAINSLGMFEICSEFISSCKDFKNSITDQIRQADSSINWEDKEQAKEDICNFLKRNWEDIDGIEPEHFVHDDTISVFELTVTLKTSIGNISHIEDKVLNAWDYTVYTPYGEFDITDD